MKFQRKYFMDGMAEDEKQMKKNNTTLILIKGLPGSGKSFWAKQEMEKHPGVYKRINKDLLREMFDCGKWSRSNEKFILEMRDFFIQTTMMKGHSVIVDDCNLAPKHEARMREIIKGWDNVLMPGDKKPWEFEIKDFTDVSPEVCIERDLKRPNSVGEKVIMQMYNQFLKPKPEVYVKDLSLPDCVMCDLDGSLALFGDKNPYDRNFEEDTVSEPVLRIIKSLPEDIKIFLVSGRTDKFRVQTENWLHKNCIPYSGLLMRQDGDVRKDTVVKGEIFNDHIKNKYNVIFVVDDRKQVKKLWVSLGLFVFDVNQQDLDF